MPRMLREIIAGIIDLEADLEIVGQVSTTDDLVRLYDRDVADIVIAAESPDVRLAAEQLLDHFPRLRVLEVVGEGRAANVYELRPTREFVANITPDSLLGALRNGRA